MKYKCVRCEMIWGDGVPELEGYSHGLCGECLKYALIPIYRKRQSEEGYFDCFGRSAGYCDQYACKYRKVCLYPS